MTPLVSILIPAYNAAPWIGETLQSALAQTWPRKEIIVVDDGSKDDTLTIARRFAAPEVKVVTQANQGASTARNHAFSLAQGEYLQWLDADDLLHPEKIALQMAAARDAGPDVLLSCEWGRFYFRPTRTRFAPGPLWRNLTPAEWLQTKMESNSFIAINAWLGSRHLYGRVGTWDTSLSADDDGEYFARVVAACRRVEFVAGARSLCRAANPQSLSRVTRSATWLRSQFTVVRRQIELLRRLDDGARTRQACLKMLQYALPLFHPGQPELARQASALASELGGALTMPDVRPKYRWIRGAFGWDAALAAQDALPALRWWCARSWDRCLAACGL